MPPDAEEMISDRIKMKNWKNFGDYCAIVYNSLVGLLENPILHLLPEINKPVLILFGRNDKFIPNTIFHKNLTTEIVAQNGSCLIPNSKLVMIDECGHFIQYEKPEFTANEIIKIFI